MPRLELMALLLAIQKLLNNGLCDEAEDLVAQVLEECKKD